MGGPCSPWATLADGERFGTCATSDEELLTTMLGVASEILYGLSGRQFPGVCTDTVRPCRNGAWPFPPGWPWTETLRDPGLWGDCGCGANSHRSCECGPVPEITLGASPLREIVEVRIDGQLLPSSHYRIDDHRWLVRTDGDAWPLSQNMLADSMSDPDTFQVTFDWGTAPPDAGVLAAWVLGCELSLARCCADKCRLPRRVQSIVRQGMSMTLLDPMDFIEKGRTGLYEVDIFLETVNPTGARSRAAVFSPDIPRPVRRTATTPGS